jgi:hypothetical protein
MPSIFLNTSDIASFIGQNKWDYITPFERLWKKYDSEYTNCLKEFNNKLADRKAELILIENDKRILEEQVKSKEITKRQYDKLLKENETKNKNVVKDIDSITSKIESISLTQSEKIEKNLGKDIIETIANASKETTDKRKITNQAIEKLEKDGKIKKEQKEELLKQTESFINKTHGTLKEDSAIKIYESQYNVNLDTSQKYYKYVFRKTNNFSWFIGGKMDGIYVDENDINNNYIIEVKNRTKGFFSSLREYEKTQIQLYMLLTGFNKTKLVEKFKDKIRVTDVPLEKEYIDDTLEYLSIFVSSIEEFFGNTQLKMKYFNLTENEKKKFLNELYLDKIEELRKHKEQLRIIKAEEECLLSDLDDEF